MKSELLQVIRTANREFQLFIGQGTPDLAKRPQARGANERLERINFCLKQVAQQMSADFGAAPREPSAAYETMKYRENLLALRRHIESLEVSLLAERDRLESVRANVRSARAWAAALREIS